VRIKYLGHAAFYIASIVGTRIITDPYEPGGYDGAIGFDPITDEADVVIVSHEHGDHNYVDGIQGDPEVVRGWVHTR
jgi:L-ascorbate metabolism protein UlaG (beta-lactamase superfamily)